MSTRDPTSLRLGRSGVDAVDHVLRELVTSLLSYLRAPYLRGNPVLGVVLPGAANFKVAHGLSRLPQGYLVTRVRNVNLSLYEDPVNKPDTKYYYFVANCTSTVDFSFF